MNRLNLLNSVQNRLIAILLIVVVLPFVIIQPLQILSSRSALIDNLNEEYNTLVEVEVNTTIATLVEQVDLLTLFAQNDQLEELLEDASESYTGTPEQIEASLLQIDEQWIAAPDNDALILFGFYL